jgi:hypothetical protein
MCGRIRTLSSEELEQTLSKYFEGTSKTPAETIEYIFQKECLNGECDQPAAHYVIQKISHMFQDTKIVKGDSENTFTLNKDYTFITPPKIRQTETTKEKYEKLAVEESIQISQAERFPFNWDKLYIGQIITVTLHTETDNPRDENAVSVKYEGEHLGYIPRTYNEKYSKLVSEIEANKKVATINIEVIQNKIGVKTGILKNYSK